MGDTQTEIERDHDNFRLLVVAMRRAQREYYASRDIADLRNVRRLELEVDWALMYERCKLYVTEIKA